MKGKLCVLLLSSLTYINCQSLSHMPVRTNKSGNNDHRTKLNLGLGPSFSMKDIFKKQGPNLLSRTDNKTSQQHKQQQFTSLSQQISGALGQLLPPPPPGFQPVVPGNTATGPEPLQNSANTGAQSGVPNTKPKASAPPSLPAAQSEPAAPAPQVKSTFNNAPAQQAQAPAPTAAQSSTANSANNPPASNPTSASSSPAANPQYSEWFGSNVPAEVSQMTPEQLSMMTERQAERLFRVQFPFQPNVNTNMVPGSPQNAAMAPNAMNTWMSGNSMTGANGLVKMMNQVLQQRVNTRVLEAMNMQEAFEIPPFATQIVCNGIVPPAPGNETTQKMFTDGTLARANAMAQGLELKVIKAAVLCHNKLAEYQACDITPNSDMRKMPCQPNTPNACQPGWSCSLYSGQMLPICCPETVRKAVMIDEGIPGA